MKHLRNLNRTLARTKFKNIYNEQGLTLLEVLLAFLILSLVVVSLLGRFAQAGRQNADTLQYNVALSLAQSKIEEIKKRNFDSIVSVPSTSFSSESDYTQYAGLSYTVTVVNNGFITKTVTVTVTYSDEGVAKQLELTTEVARR